MLTREWLDKLTLDILSLGYLLANILPPSPP